MTLRKLYLGFNLSLLVTLAFCIALPVFLLGDGAAEYFEDNTITIGLILLSFIAINIYFVINWTIFSALEQGDWSSLLQLLRSKIFEHNCYRRKYIFYFIEVAIQLNDLELLRELYEELQSRSSLLDKVSRSYLNGHFNGCPANWRQGEISRLFPLQRLLFSGSCRESLKNYRLARQARKRLCEYAIEFGLPCLIDDPGEGSELYFGNLREFAAFQALSYIHKYKWAELFYAIALLVQGKWQYAASLLEELLLPQQQFFQRLPSERRGRGRQSLKWAGLRLRHRLREDALLQLVSIQLLEDLQENMQEFCVHAPGAVRAQVQAEFSVDRQLIALRRAEIQKVYGSPKHWSTYLLKEQSQNIAIAMIRQLITSAYEQQLRPAHQAYLAALEARGKVSKASLNNQSSTYQR